MLHVHAFFFFVFVFVCASVYALREVYSSVNIRRHDEEEEMMRMILLNDDDDRLTAPNETTHSKCVDVCVAVCERVRKTRE